MFKFLLKKYEKQIYELADRAVKEAEIFWEVAKAKRKSKWRLILFCVFYHFHRI